MKINKKIVQAIRKLMSDVRYLRIKKFVIGKSLDIACEWKRYLFDVCSDLNPKENGIEKQDIEKLTYKDKSFDTVSCLEVLEHLYNPIDAIKELKRVARKRIIVSVPSEPWFSLIPRLSWNKEHLWAITPRALEYHFKDFGKVIYKKRFLIRWNILVFEDERKN